MQKKRIFVFFGNEETKNAKTKQHQKILITKTQKAYVTFVWVVNVRTAQTSLPLTV